RVVLLPGPSGPQHVVEQQLADVPRGQPGQLEPGPVHDHLAERPDLGLDAEAHRGLPLPFQASSDHCDSADITEPTLAAEKIESTDATEPTDAIDSTEPAEPIDRMDPLDPMERMDPVEPMDRIDPLEPMLSMEPALPSATLLFRMEPLSQRIAHARHLSAWCKSGLRYTRCWPTGPRSRSARPSRPTSTRSRPCTKRCPRTTATCGSSTSAGSRPSARPGGSAATRPRAAQRCWASRTARWSAWPATSRSEKIRSRPRSRSRWPTTCTTGASPPCCSSTWSHWPAAARSPR